jgi:hypothetical protein
MDIRKQLEARMFGRKPPKTKFGMVRVDTDIKYLDCQHRLSYIVELHVGAYVTVDREASLEKAKEMIVPIIASELYGEIKDEAYRLMMLLLNEECRPEDDPIMQSLKRIMRLSNGGE